MLNLKQKDSIMVTKMKMPKINFQKLFDNNKLVIVLSFIIAITALFVVKTVVNPEGNVKISNVPITINLDGSTAATAGLKVISKEVDTVTAVISGKSYWVGNLTADDISVTARVVDVTKAGEYTLDLSVALLPEAQKDSDYKIEVKPDKVKVRFDTIISQEFPITVETGKIEVDEGLIVDTAFAQPEKITVSGPQKDVETIAKCVAKTEAVGHVSETVVKKGEISFYDKDNKKLEFNNILTYEPQTVDVTVPILRSKTVPLTFEYTNVPDGFPIDSLKYTMSHTTLKITAPNSTIDTLEEISLGVIDFRQIDVGSVFTREVNLLAGFKNADDISEVTITFPTNNMGSRSPFTVTNIKLANTPTDYNVKLLNTRINNVKIVGAKDIVKNISAADIVATVDFRDVTVTKGDIWCPVRFTIPNKGLVWVSGEYRVTVRVSDK